MTKKCPSWPKNKADCGCMHCATQGLRAAEMTALPTTIVQEAKSIASRVSQQLQVKLIDSILFCLWFLSYRGLFFSSAFDTNAHIMFCFLVLFYYLNVNVVDPNVKTKPMNVIHHHRRPNIRAIQRHRSKELSITWPLAFCRPPETQGWTQTACECTWKAWRSSMRPSCRQQNCWQQGRQPLLTRRRNDWLSAAVGRKGSYWHLIVIAEFVRASWC